MTLYKILKYKNKDLLARYQKDYPNNHLKPKEALIELLKYFWLIRKHQKAVMLHPKKTSLQFSAGIHSEMKEIDDMWHTFLLFTQDYTDFCQKYFSGFIHHVPNMKNKPAKTAAFKKNLRKYLSYIYDNLGEKTLRTWFRNSLK